MFSSLKYANNNKKDLVLGLVAVLLLTTLAFVQVNQTWQYRKLEQDIAILEKEQSLVYEENKRLLGSITELESPERLIGLVEEYKAWDLVKIKPNDVVLIKGKDE